MERGTATLGPEIPPQYDRGAEQYAAGALVEFEALTGACQSTLAHLARLPRTDLLRHPAEMGTVRDGAADRIDVAIWHEQVSIRAVRA